VYVWLRGYHCVCVAQGISLCMCGSGDIAVYVWLRGYRCVCVAQGISLCLCGSGDIAVYVWLRGYRCVCVVQGISLCLCGSGDIPPGVRGQGASDLPGSGSISSSGKAFVFHNTIGFSRPRRPTYRVKFSIGQAGASKKSPDNATWEMLNEKTKWAKFCIPLTLVIIPAGYLHTPVTGHDTCGVPAYP